MKQIHLMLLPLALASSLAQASSFGPHALEPAINGSVSASGRFPTQALEERYGQSPVLELEFRQRELEPALNGSVSRSGLFPSQELEDAAGNRVDGAECVILQTESGVSLLGKACGAS
jgi:hypothetical protein